MKKKILIGLLGMLLIAPFGCRRSSEIPGVVVGTSMAPTLLGEHYLIECDDCGIEMRFELAEKSLLNPQVTCSNCGHKLTFERSSRQPAQTVSIIPTIEINRWDIVAFQIPRAETVGIKRVIGLPAERIEFRKGNVWANGVLQKKDWSLQKECRILVHDDRFMPQTSLPPRWSIVENKSQQGWQARDQNWYFQQGNTESSVTDSDQDEDGWNWLSYQHWRGCRHVGQRSDLFPIEDVDSFNQSLARSLHPTADLFLEIDGLISEDATIGWRFFRGNSSLIVELDLAANSVSVVEQRLNSANANHLQPLDVAAEISTRSFRIDQSVKLVSRLQVSTFDNRLTIAINERPILVTDIGEVEGELAAENIVWIGAKRGIVQLDRIAIYRDIYYFDADFQQKSISAEEKSFLVVGDNVPTSTDSRHWRNGGINQRSILGKVRE